MNLVPLGIGGGELSHSVNGDGSRFGSGRQGQDTFVAHTLRAEGHDASEDGTGRGTPIIPIDMRQASRGATMTNNRADGSSGGAPGTGIGEAGDPSPTVAGSHTPAVAFGIRSDATREGTAKTPSADANGVVRLRDPGLGITEELSPTIDSGAAHAVAYQCHGSNVGPMGTVRQGNGGVTGGVPFVFEPRIGRNDRGQPSEVVNTLKGSEAGDTSDMRPVVAGGSMGVRRLTPVECLRLQGFPDDWLDGLELSDSAKYRMCGNAVCVNVSEWIGKRIIESQFLPRLPGKAAD